MANPYPADFQDGGGNVRLSGKVNFTDPANQPGGGTTAGAARVLTYDFGVAQAAALAVGVPVCTFAAGDVLLDAWIVTAYAAAWVGEQVLSLADIGVISAGAWVDSGFFNRSTGPVDLATATWDAAAPLLRYSHSFNSTAPPSLLGVAIASGGGAFCDPRTHFTGAATLSLAVSGDGTPAGTPFDGIVGASTLYLLVTTPTAAA